MSRAGGGLGQAVLDALESPRAPDEPLVNQHTDTGWTAVTPEALARRARTIATALADRVRTGDRVLLTGPAGIDWYAADVALLLLGAASVPVYVTSSRAQIAHMASDSGAILALTTSTDALGELPTVATAGIDTEGPSDLPARSVLPTDLATIIYTSGTTGSPRGCALTHANLLAATTALRDATGDMLGPHARAVSLLPPAHAYPRVLGLTLLLSHTPTWVVDPGTLGPALARIAPTLLPAVPRVLERLYGSVRSSLASTPSTGPPMSIADALTRALGGACRHVLTAGAPLPVQIGTDLTAAGVTVLDAWGMTETATLGAITRPGSWTPGVLGTASPGTSLRINPRGELEVHSPGLFAGYLDDPAATAAALTPDGWLRTGDLASLDDRGRLRLHGRNKDVLVTSGGKNVAAATTERALAASPLVSNALLVADGRPFVTALLTLDPAGLTAAGLAPPPRDALMDLGRDPGPRSTVLRGGIPEELHAELDDLIARHNATVSRAESIRRYAVLDRDLTREHDELTPTGKVRRTAVLHGWATLVDLMYQARA